MTNKFLLNDSEHWHARAEEARLLAKENKMRCVYWSSDVRTRFVAALWERHSPRGRGNLRRWLSSGADELFLSIAAGERGNGRAGESWYRS